jgi:ATP-binding cassette subfamily A (ABC1) protein 3
VFFPELTNAQHSQLRLLLLTCSAVLCLQTTAISVLTGLIAPDYSHTTGPSPSGTYIYNRNILKEMEAIRYSLGVCPQHDVLFESLNVREHILFFSQLKGVDYSTAEEEVDRLTSFFKLSSRLDHLGAELSGGQKRMLSIAIAICGGSKFVVFDEPTAGEREVEVWRAQM